ncbi:thiamine pyrophosphate-binding protein [Paenibacillus filicis]|uniref:Thiamine pyrophosphate-binding protein n=1 Tax=Paenibacillus gyeongsangnamensis TaxID=3388067 RepID=A0ABT4QBV4_9BACL|nr:thiamine pyrophosphate-binding protein [Paenibacillus filicis]MCZ8514266.1 thiamine pyrophosphate-binding protein [Paenibacillus filicis]
MVQITPEVKTTQPVNANLPKSTQSLNVSRFLIDQLASWGVKRIFGVIGDATLFLLDELAKQNRIQYIACAHECGAALMASAEAKLTGRIGVCLATSGPGIANLLNGLGDASMDGAGVLAITGQVETKKIGTSTKQYINQQRLISPIAEQTELLTHPDALPDLLQKALINAQVMGKVTHLSIPKDLFQQQVQGEIYTYNAHLHQTLMTPVEHIQETVNMLKSSQKPVFLLGRGVKNSASSVRELAEKLPAAVITTMPARSLFPNDHPLFAGGLGEAGSEAASLLLAESDLILILGGTWWPDDYIPNHLPIVQMDKVPAQIGLGRVVKKGIVGDLQMVVPQLLKEFKSDSSIRTDWEKRIAEVRGTWKQQIEKEADSEGTPIPPQRVIKAIADYVDPDAVIALDTGDHTIWFNRIFQAKRQDILVSGRWRTMGFGLPAAIAAQLEFPLRQVVAVVGDGGVLQTMMEFITAVRYQLPVIVIVMNNGSYAMEKNRMEVSGLNTMGSELGCPDFAMIAQSCGGRGLKADNAQQFEELLRLALQQRKPTIIDVKTADTLVPHTKI